jgi:hypothetical protein
LAEVDGFAADFSGLALLLEALLLLALAFDF